MDGLDSTVIFWSISCCAGVLIMIVTIAYYYTRQ